LHVHAGDQADPLPGVLRPQPQPTPEAGRLVFALVAEMSAERGLVAAAFRCGRRGLLAIGRHAGAGFLDLGLALLGDLRRQRGGRGVGRATAMATLAAVEALLAVGTLLPLGALLPVGARLPIGARLRVAALAPISTPLLMALLVLARLAGFFCLPRLARGGARLEAGDDAALDLAVHQTLDCVHERTLFIADERDRFAFGACTAGAADAVDVVFS